MNRYPKFARKKSQQDGYALILVVFLTTMLLISIMGISLSIRTEKQREKEQEMIWRGNQYVRGIRMYYRKTGRFPTAIDDLTKPKIGSLRFMRKAYTDPMNKEDGSWRLIYVGPAGQLIGSLKPQQTFQLPGVAGATPAAAVGQQANSSAFGQSAFGSTFGQSGTQAGSQPGTQTTPNANPQGGAQTTGQGTGSAADDSALPASATASDSPIIGGNIIGVGSKVNKRSVIVYDKAKNLRLFEFVWNPSKDLQNALGQAGVPLATPGTGAPGTVAPASNPAPTGPGTPQPTPPLQEQQPPQ